MGSKTDTEDPSARQLSVEVGKILRQQIEQQGVIPFARFMELALYCPECGYYERGGGAIGRAGDFYTSVSTGSLFGELLAFQFAEWLAELPSHPVHLVEAGAHDGQLGRDILNWLGRNRPALIELLEFWIVEPSPRRQVRQEGNLKAFAERVRWFESLAALPRPGINGVIFSNELLDATPVHRLGWDATAKSWFEWGVSFHNGGFVWGRLPQLPSDVLLRTVGMDLPARLTAILPDGFTVEVCPTAAEWWRRAAGALRRGKLLTLDYGCTAEELFTPERTNGTLRAYYRHHSCADPLANPGEQDLTAHVNFTALQSAGEATGLCTEGLLTQAQFLTRIAERKWKEEASAGRWTPEQVRQFQTLTHPEHLGRAFQVLIQTRSIHE